MLFGAVSATLIESAANPRWLGGTAAFSLVLHTWKQDLGHHVPWPDYRYRHRSACSQPGSSRFGSRSASANASSRGSIRNRQSRGRSATQNIVK